jgi:hypothetical protein
VEPPQTSDPSHPEPQPVPQQFYAPPVSPDGKFWWNGYQWIPLQRQTNPALFLMAGCGVVLVVILLLVALGVANFHGSIYSNNNQIFSNISNSLTQ